MNGRTGFFILLVVALLLMGTAPGAAYTSSDKQTTSLANVIIVANANDSGAGSLRQALVDANSGDTILFAAGVTGVITLTSGQLLIDKALTIIGPGASALAISGNHASRVLRVIGSAVSLSGLTIRDGSADAGGGIFNLGTLTLTDAIIEDNVAANQGGGIENQDTLTLRDVTIHHNTAGSDGGGIRNYSGSSITLNRVTLSENTASIDGGGINNRGTLTATNITVSGNAAGGTGGGIANSVSITLTNGTISDNNGHGFFMDGYSYTKAALKNTLIANNSTGNCILNRPITSQGHNLSSDDSCAGSFIAAGDLNNTAPLLDALADNGGSTQTQALQPGSPAIDAGTNDGCPATDQREATRPLDGNRDGSAVCDIGAVEFVSSSGATYWTSGWVNAPSPGATLNFTHSLGGDPASYAVELWFRDTATPGAGINQRFYGGESVGPGPIGAYWRRLTDTSIQLYREAADDIVDQVYLRIWQPDPPDWDSGWQDIAPGQTLTLTHNLGGSTDDYVVGIKFRDTAPGGYGIHQRALGGSDWNGSYDGAAWFSLTGSSIRVVRFANDQEIDRVRLTISLPSTPPAFDSGWRSIGQGVTQVITHNLAGNVNTYSVRYSARSAIHGNNIMGAGGIEIGGNYLGTNWENLTGNSINLHRWSSDIYAPEVRVRIFLPTFHVYLPLILK